MATQMARDLSGARLPLPPPFTLRRTEARDVLAEGMRLAPSEGAGTLLLHQAPGLLAFAVVLEPDRVLAEARLAFLVGMTALGDALGAHCPPERPVRVIWPDRVLYDAAWLGGGRFAVAPGTAEDAVPDWMVFAAELIADRDQVTEPGRFPASTSLKEEDFDPAEQIISTFASYLMLYFDRWTHEGFDAVTSRYLERLEPPLEDGVRMLRGDKLVESTPAGERAFPPLAQALAASDWRDSRGPKL